MNIVTILLIGLGVVVLLFVLDLMFAGGAGTMGMMHGTAMMVSNPIGQGILLALLAILGVLVYAVCSIEPEEGVDVVNAVLAGRNDLQRGDIKTSHPALSRFLNADGDLFILPGHEDMDGFYATRLVKKTGGA